jgi:very-short-patch-repair endonuclease
MSGFMPHSERRQFNGKVCDKLGEHVLWLAVEYGPDLAARFAETFARLYVKCESPIETALLDQFAATELNGCWVADAQVSVEGVGRVDFVLRHPSSTTAIAIECDGHDFHERTKQQAARDRKRDRTLQALGYVVLRFTGSEIVGNRAEVCREIGQALLRLVPLQADAEAA